MKEKIFYFVRSLEIRPELTLLDNPSDSLQRSCINGCPTLGYSSGALEIWRLAYD